MQFRSLQPMRLLGPVVLAAALALGAPAAEAVVSYSFTSAAGSSAASSKSFASGLYTVTASAWSNGGSGGTLTAGQLGFYSGGLGVNNGFAADANEGVPPEHAVDSDFYVDSILLDFGPTALYNMTGFSTGWVQTDADLVILAYTGSGAPGSIAGQTYANLLGNGWVGSKYRNVCASPTAGSSGGCSGNVGSSQSTANSSTAALTGISSRYWLVASYNSVFGALTGQSITDSYKEYFKLASITGDVTQLTNIVVPLPATTALLGIGVLALWRRRRVGAGLG